MFNFSEFINLPLTWGLLIAIALLVYVLLDGFDLGVGIIFPYAPSEKSHHCLMNSISPFWDSNETWIVLAGGGLFVVFPLAFAILMPAFYIPIFLMLFSLILRGSAIEFWHKSSKNERKIWQWVLSISSLTASLSQGAIFGAFLSGVKINQRNFSGDAFDWLSPFSIMSSLGVTIIYVLLGSTWIIAKSENDTAYWAKIIAKKTSLYASIMSLMAGILITIKHSSIYVFNNENQKLIDLPLKNLVIFTGIISAIIFYLISYILSKKYQKNEYNSDNLAENTDLLVNKNIKLNKFNFTDFKPFFLTYIGIIVSYVGIMASVYPYAIPYSYTFADVASSNESLSLTLLGTMVFLPLAICYTIYVFYVFKGKVEDEVNY
ncbi:cytochrome d ubiquinol oxidase subunit II [Lyticum sinuosum]|uniref:Cytochrome d ubiquinol oxidase subunit 2 n=1 Tax=Lyticum sinuosum TaxID=1332059 RepID=A0AAE4VMD7_9RICK|nr:cytochrome d ubiquinol oxidase subunit II [Lyticum sinuosum]MDZ5761503.1 Cytochrome d ubiquinol oxidase subunit 2 [Lyticum sinuosum]